MRIDPFTALRVFFTTHYRVLTEERMHELYDISQHETTYDEDEMRKDFEEEPISCINDNCENQGLPIPTNLEVNATYGNKGVNVIRKGICPTCNEESEIYLRFKNGMIMNKAPNGEWFCIVREQPLLQYYVGCLILTIKELFS